MVYLACRREGKGWKGSLRRLYCKNWLRGTGLTLARFEDYYVVERSHFHSFNNSNKYWASISRISIYMGLVGGVSGVICNLGRFPIVSHFRVRDGSYRWSHTPTRSHT